MKVRIKNFQSIEDLSLEFPEKGFTCLVGQSNIGKSAIRRALECVFYNKSETSYIRKGTAECRVEIKFDDGMEVVWYRDEKTSGYIVNGEDFTKLNKTVPQPLIDKGFKELIINKEKYSVQIASQFDNIFLLNEPGGKVTEVLSNLGNLNKIINANKSCLTDLKNNKSKVSLRKEDLLSLKEKLKNFRGLDEQTNHIEKIRETFDNLKKSQEIIQKLKISQENLQRIVVLIRSLRQGSTISVDYPEIDLNKLNDIKRIGSKYESSLKTTMVLKKVADIKDILLDISDKVFIKLKEVYDKYLRANNSCTILSKLSDVKDIIFDLDTIYTSYTAISNVFSKYTLSKTKSELYTHLPKEEIIFDIAYDKVKEIRILYDRAIKCKNTIISLRKNIEDTSTLLESLEKEEKEIHTTIKFCPLCNKEF